MSEKEEVVTAPVTVQVTHSSKKCGGELESEGVTETVEVRAFETTPAVVKFGLDAKRCLKFNSAGVFVGVDLPCYVEEIPDAYEAAKRMVRERILAELPSLNKTLEQMMD